MKRKNDHKVGIKILSDAQLENVLPTYENLFDKIEVCREVAKEVSGDIERHYQYNFMYDNVFSILGNRGTGKTSVAFTLKEKIQGPENKKEKEKAEDIVLPLIIPEVIPENCTVLGWLLAIVREEIEQLEKHISELENSKNMERCWNGCNLSNKLDKDSLLLAQLDNMNQLLHAGNYNPGNEQSYYKAINNSVIQAGDYYKFAKEIACLWDAWVERIQHYAYLKGKEKPTPLIYFIFDDVDLSPEKIDEILSVIIKYLSHPNIIVITTADEKLFLEVIKNKLDRDIGRLPSEWREYLIQNREDYFGTWKDDHADIRKKEEDIARRYLGKVLPASSRYYLKLFNSGKQKQKFCIENEHDLGLEVKAQMQRLVDSAGNENGVVNNFMIREDEIGFFYLKFMGNTSRQIGNVYIALRELVDSLLKIAKSNKKQRDPILLVYNKMAFFLRVAINSNHSLAQAIENVDVFVDETFLYNYNQWKLYVNYSKLNEFLEYELSEEKKEEKIGIGIALFSLYVFVENILLIMEHVLPGGITNRMKNHSVRFFSRFLQKEISSIRYILSSEMAADEFYFHYANLLDRLENMNPGEMTDVKFNLEYFYDFKDYSYGTVTENNLVTIYKKDPIWFRELIGRLFLVYGNAYLIDKQDIKNCFIEWDTWYPTKYQSVVEEAIIKNIIQVFEVPEIHRKWEEILETEEHEIKIEESESIEEFCDQFRAMILGEKELAQNEYIGIDEIINFINDEMESWDDIYPLQKAVLGDFTKNLWELRFKNADDILSLIKNMNTKTETAEYLLSNYNEKAIIKDPARILNTIAEMKRNYFMPDSELDEIVQSINEYLKNGRQESIVVDIYLYNNLVKKVNDILLWSNKRNMYDEEYAELQRNAKNVMKSLNLAVDMNDEIEFRQAVQVAICIKATIFLQSFYLFSLAHERYHGRNSCASRELERMKNGSKEKSTYYYRFFISACRMIKKLEEKVIRDSSSETALVIEKAYLQERRNYVRSILPGDSNE